MSWGQARSRGGGSSGEDYDEMYDHAVAIVTETQQASISMVQRRLRWDITALVIEHMER